MKIVELLEVSRVKLSTDPDNYGATITDFNPLERVVNIPINKIDVFEPDDKFNDPYYAKNLKNIVAALKKGQELPPILVRRQGKRFQVMDGHHRFKAYRILKLKEIPARIVSKINIKDI
jgi:ParB family chromosome partitioning protein